MIPVMLRLASLLQNLHAGALARPIRQFHPEGMVMAKVQPLLDLIEDYREGNIRAKLLACFGVLLVLAAGSCDGSLPNVSVTVTPEAVGDHCAAGGLKIVVTVSPAAEAYVCNGLDGAVLAEAHVDARLEQAGDHCKDGGVIIETWVGDGAKVQSYACNGALGNDGVAGTDGINGTDGMAGLPGASVVVTAEAPGNRGAV
jgi:hypothetical protein